MVVINREIFCEFFENEVLVFVYDYIKYMCLLDELLLYVVTY